MPRVCQLSGKKTHSGRTYTTRGLAKSKGGIGKKITGKTLRRFRPNIQRVRAVVNGRTVRIKVTAKLLRRGVIEKPARRNYKPEQAAAKSE